MHQVFAEVPIQGISTTFSSYNNFGDLISVIVRNVMMIAGVISLFFLVMGGFSVIMAAGGGDSKKMESGKKTMTSAVIGLLLIFLSFWIVQIIGAITGINIFNPMGSSGPGPTPI
jgi:hypothetical protein